MLFASGDYCNVNSKLGDKTWLSEAKDEIWKQFKPSKPYLGVYAKVFYHF